MRKIRTMRELDKIQDEAYQDACSSDLCLIRYAFRLWDGFLVICTNETILDVKKGVYYIDNKDYEKWSEGNKHYFKWYYLGEHEWPKNQ